MGRSRKKGSRAQRRGQLAAIQMLAVGVAFIVLPHVFKTPAVAAGFRSLATVGWMLLVAGGAMTFLLRPKAPGGAVSDRSGLDFQPPARAPRRPSKPPPLVERLDPIVPAAAALAEESTNSLRPTLWGLKVFEVIEWRRFEAVVEALFAQAGFLTKSQSHGPDEGVDVWLYSKNKVDGAPVSIVQCKHWQGKRVGVDKVRELRGVMASSGVMRGQFASTSTFTPDAIAFAEKNGIKLHDGPGLVELIRTRTTEQQQALLDVALEGDYWRPTCVNCGIKMVDKARQTGGSSFWGCANFPRCRTTMQKRAA